MKRISLQISAILLSVTLKQEGYEDFYTVLNKNEKADAGAIVGGIFFLFPFIWTMGYNPSHTYEMYLVQ